MARQPDKLLKSEVATALSFFQHVKTRFEDEPAVYEDLLLILRRFKTGETPDRREVATKTYTLLHGHPDLVGRLDAFFADEHAPEPAREDPTPRRPKRERRPTPTATATAAVDQGARTRAVHYFLERVSTRQEGLYERLLELISEATTDLNPIYQRARQVFGSANSDLLREFTEYLPQNPTGRQRDVLLRRIEEEEEEEEEHCAPAPKRKAAAVAANTPSAAKRSHADDRRAINRRANPPAVVDAAPKVSAFREAWEFETTYTKLVATARRTKELLSAYDEPPEDAPPPPPSGRRAFEELFPSRECQEVLREMYQRMLGPIREALEDGARTELALRTIKRRLGMLEEVAVKMAMERRDRARVEGRMYKLATDRVLVLRKNQAKQSAGTCSHPVTRTCKS